MTAHIDAKPGDIAKTVIMPGCPVRAKLFAEKYLESPKLVNTLRMMNMYTGTYKGKPISICASGMGIPSMGIYSFELYNFYGVERIIRVGTCGAYSKNLKICDLFLVTEAYGDLKDYLELLTDQNSYLSYPTAELVAQLEESANKLGIKYHKGRCHCTAAFYSAKPVEYLIEMTKADCVEMETYALFINAKLANKQAAAVLTVTDLIYPEEGQTKREEIGPHEREEVANAAIQLVLNIL